MGCLCLSPVSEELRSRQFWRAMLAELIGTLVLVSAVLGASLPGPGEAPGGPLYPAIAVGVVIVAVAHCFGEISGAQVSHESLDADGCQVTSDHFHSECSWDSKYIYTTWG